MYRITLTDFVDIVSKSGTSKATNVAKVKHRKPYSPATDFYKGIREAIIDIVEHDRDKTTLDSAIEKATPKRKGHYAQVANGAKKWIGRKKIEWFDPTKGLYGTGGIQVSVNPEIGAVVNGTPHLIKLYFKADKLPKNHALISTHLMKECLEGSAPEGVVMSVLDVKRGKMMDYETPNEKLAAALKGELAYIESLWDSV